MDNNIGSSSRRLGGIFLIIGWLIFLGLAGFLIQESVYRTKKPTINETYAGTQITIYRDLDSHFRIEGSINGVPVTFLIDTGATSIAVSEQIARRANLTRLSEINTETANGNAISYFTTITTLQFNKIELHNLSAIIVPGMDSGVALLGMNVLKQFTIKQTPETLIISVPSHDSQQ